MGIQTVQLKLYALNGNLMEEQSHDLPLTGSRLSGYSITFNPYRQFMGEIEEFVKRQAWNTVGDGRYGFRAVITLNGEDWKRARVAVTVKKGKIAIGKVPTGFGRGTAWGELISISEWK